MGLPARPPDKRSYTPQERVRVRRQIVTAGEHAECPRCRSSLSFGRRARAGRKPEIYRLHCGGCGCTMNLGDIPDGVFGH
jgi:transcription elongation factor Elf1